MPILSASETWEQIKSKTGTPFVRSNYIWLGLVPAAAENLQEVDSEVQLSLGESNITIVMQLPFSWQLFYWGAVAFVLAHISFLSFCPPYIRKINDFQD